MNLGVRLVLGTAAGLVTAGATCAATPAPTQGFLACATEMDDARRLACFDAAVDLARTQPGPSAHAAGAATAAAAAEPPLSQEEKFGLRGDLKAEKAKKLPELRELDELAAQVTQVTAKPQGGLVMTLDNGQVWSEIQSVSGIRVKAGDRVTIKPGALGSYLLVAPNGRSSKVTRAR